MSEENEERRLFREAVDLAIRLQDDPENPVSIDTVRAWIARGPAHERAWSRVAEIHGMAGKILSASGDAAGDGPTLPTRRSVIVGGVAGVALAAGAWYGPGILLDLSADHRTATAEIRNVELDDGSVVTLGPASAIAVDYTPAARRVLLLQGMAFFDVAPIASRPFSVVAGDIRATALGTAFDVSRDAGAVAVSVDEGRIEARAAAPAPTEELQAGDWIVFDDHRIHRGRRDISQIAAWRRGMIVAEDEMVSALVDRISRWQPGKVVVADPFLGGSRVSGVFDLSDPVRALEALVRPFGARVRQPTPYLTVISPV